jgi:flagellar basal body-associated protein FliL
MFGGGFGGYRAGWYGNGAVAPGGGGNLLWIILVVLVVLFLFGGLGYYSYGGL